MRGVDDQLRVGERIAFYRQRRSLTQAALAGLEQPQSPPDDRCLRRGAAHLEQHCEAVARNRDNQALTTLCESVATVPMVVFPRINAAHARQPAWAEHIIRLRSAGETLIDGEDVWPLAEPRAAGSRVLPWSAILSAAESLAGRVS